MISQVDLVPVGRIGRPHGYRGEAMLNFHDAGLEQTVDSADTDCVFLEVEGIPVPFFWEDFRLTGRLSAIVKFHGVDTREQARGLTGCEALMERDALGAVDGLPAKGSLIGYTMVDARTGLEVGRVASVDDSTENVLFIVEGADGRGLMVPASGDLIEGVDGEGRVLRVSLPDGLLEIND